MYGGGHAIVLWGAQEELLTWALRAATRMAAAVSEGGNCRMAMSESASVASANAQPAARRTAVPSDRSQPKRWQYTLRQWMAAMHSMSWRSTAMMLDSILSRAMSARPALASAFLRSSSEV